MKAAFALGRAGCSWSVRLAAQAPDNAAGAPAQAARRPASAAAVLSAERSGETSTLTYFNRPIVVLRARVLGRPPAERATGRRRDPRRSGRSSGITGPVESRALEGGRAHQRGLASRRRVGPPDIDELSGETLRRRDGADRRASAAGASEAAEARTPVVLASRRGVSRPRACRRRAAAVGRRQARRVVAGEAGLRSPSRRSRKPGIADLAALRASRAARFPARARDGGDDRSATRRRLQPHHVSSSDGSPTPVPGASR